MARAWMKAALAGMAIMAMTAPVHAADTIKIGVPGAHSGDLVSYGMPSLNAARIVADEYNAKGGILGKQIEIVAEEKSGQIARHRGVGLPRQPFDLGHVGLRNAFGNEQPAVGRQPHHRGLAQ